MSFTRIVSRDEWTNVSVASEILQKIKILLWQDPAINEILKAISTERKVCPVIEIWRINLPTRIKRTGT